MELESFRLAVLNPGGRDPDQDFPDFAGAPDPKLHAPVNYHGYAAATGGAFLKSVDSVRTRKISSVLLLLRSELETSLKVLRELKNGGVRVFVSFKESGIHQVSATLLKSKNGERFREICHEAHGAVSSTRDLVAVYEAVGARKVEFIPTPYPLNDPRWNFSQPTSSRQGIFVGTREFDIPSRNHALALLIALQLGREFSETVTVVNDVGRRGRRQIEQIATACPEAKFKIIEGRRSYPEYLQTMAHHRIVWQWDQSAVPGQVAGDALLCGIPCVGGNGAMERLAFPDWCGHGRSLTEARDIAKRLLSDAADCADVSAQALDDARQKLSFEAIRLQLASLFCS